MSFEENSSDNLELFLTTWPLKSIAKMTLAQYANLSDHNSFCYWLEYRSANLGEIGGIPLTKFGLWKYKVRKDFSEQYLTDDSYAWSSKYGATRDEAFGEIKRIVESIANAAYVGDWVTIERIKFHSVAKWKIAFLYSNLQLLPIYTREGLLKIVCGLGGKYSEDSPFYKLNEFIISRKPTDIDVINYARELWDHYVKGKPFRNYYIVGTEFKDYDIDKGFQILLETNTIAVDCLKHIDLSPYIFASDDEIDRLVLSQINDPKRVTSIQRYIKTLLKIKPGDIIAIKCNYGIGNIKILSYAVVVMRNDKIYEHLPNECGHHIHVEFVEKELSHSISLNYSGSIYFIEPEKQEHLRKIFGNFLLVDNLPISNDYNVEQDNSKSESDYTRGPIASKIVKQLHNKIQNSLFRFLRTQFPKDIIKLEYKNRVDIWRENDENIWIYEIKPYQSVFACFRDAVGQLIEYSFMFKSDKNITLVVVGPSEVSREAENYINYYRELIKLNIEYLNHVSMIYQNN